MEIFLLCGLFILNSVVAFKFGFFNGYEAGINKAFAIIEQHEKGE